MDDSLYQRLGGEAAITAAVTLFYEKVMGDDTLAPFFDGLDIDAQVAKQISFMTMALGGPHRYTGRDLRVAHSKLVDRGLGDSHFDAVARHLGAALDELSVPAALRDEALTLVGSTRSHVLGR